MSTSAVLRQRRDTAANWTSNDPILEDGQMGFETDTGLFKFGNGTDEWSALPYPSFGIVVEYQLAASDLTTVLTTGTNKAYFRAPRAFLLTEVRASLLTAAASGTVTVDINKNGTTMLSTKLTIDATEETSETAATPAVIDAAEDDVADDDEITIDIDTVGDTSAGLIVTLIGTPA